MFLQVLLTHLYNPESWYIEVPVASGGLTFGGLALKTNSPMHSVKALLIFNRVWHRV